MVAGKGGVGKSTVAAALALGAAAAGRRTLVVELSGRLDVAHLLGHQGQGGLVETELEPDLFHISIEPEAVLEDYLEHEVPGPFPAGRLARSRTFSMFVDATPGMSELLAIGKVWELTRRPRRRRGGRPYDLVVLDGPASGHLIGVLKAPRTFGAIARMGPVARQTTEIDRLLTDRRLAGVVAVATPEQMAVSEAIALRDGLATLGVALDAAVVNKTLSFRLSAPEVNALQATSGDSAVSSALWLSERARAQRSHLDRLHRELPDIPLARLPFSFEELDRSGAGRLARPLERL